MKEAGFKAAAWKNSSYVFVLEKLTRNNALANCQSKRMELVSIESAEENEFLKVEQESIGALWWTGASLDKQTKSKWQWGDSGSLWSAHGTEGNNNSSPGEP